MHSIQASAVFFLLTGSRLYKGHEGIIHNFSSGVCFIHWGYSCISNEISHLIAISVLVFISKRAKLSQLNIQIFQFVTNISTSPGIFSTKQFLLVLWSLKIWIIVWLIFDWVICTWKKITICCVVHQYIVSVAGTFSYYKKKLAHCCNLRHWT